jgi:hypothetical protein
MCGSFTYRMPFWGCGPWFLVPGAWSLAPFLLMLLVEVASVLGAWSLVTGPWSLSFHGFLLRLPPPLLPGPWSLVPGPWSISFQGFLSRLAPLPSNLFVGKSTAPFKQMSLRAISKLCKHAPACIGVCANMFLWASASFVSG